MSQRVEIHNALSRARNETAVAGGRRGRFERKPANLRGCGEEPFVLTRFSPTPPTRIGASATALRRSATAGTPARHANVTAEPGRATGSTAGKRLIAAPWRLRRPRALDKTAGFPTGGATKTDSRGPPTVVNG